MTQRECATIAAKAARFVTTGLAVTGAAVALAGVAGADPIEPVPTPDPAAAAPVLPVDNAVPEAAAPAPALPVGPPMVPEIANPVYGAGQTPGQFGYIRDLWHAARSGNPMEALSSAPGDAPAAGAPAGAGPAPKLPPGYTSLTAPESSTPATQQDPSGGPALPPGYFPINGAPPPGWYDPAPAGPIFPSPAG